MNYIPIQLISMFSKLFLCKTVQLNTVFLETQEPMISLPPPVIGKITPENVPEVFSKVVGQDFAEEIPRWKNPLEQI